MPSPKKDVIKHSGAIHIANRISLLQRKVWNVMLAYAYNQLLHQETHQIRIRDLAEHVGFDSKNIAYFKEALRALNATQVEWNVLRKSQEEWGAFTLLAEVSIINGVCSYAYAPTLRERLRNPRLYARINLSLQNQFQSKHALALYELCADYFQEKRQYGETAFIDLAALRQLLGVEEDEYPRYKDFNLYVLKKALREINGKSNLLVKSLAQRQARRVVAHKFLIQKHPVNSLPSQAIPANAALRPQELPIDNLELFRVLTEEIGIAQPAAVEILRTTDELQITENLNYVKRELRNRKQIDNPAGYAVKAIRENYAKENIEKKQAKAQRRERQAQKEKLLALQEQIRQDFAAHRRKRVEREFGEYTPEKQRSFFQQAEARLKTSDFLWRRYLEKGFNDPAAKGVLAECVMETFTEPEYADLRHFAQSRGYDLAQIETQLRTLETEIPSGIPAAKETSASPA